ncbi:MAG TPA: hypothetical protein VL486_07755 [Verrucomicrobiae bacterium]|nr:hypothetical protein [Verrucomicrobiae bacterium]
MTGTSDGTVAELLARAVCSCGAMGRKRILGLGHAEGRLNGKHADKTKEFWGTSANHTLSVEQLWTLAESALVD